MAVAVTNTKIINLQAEIVETANAATSTVANTAEVFTVTPSTAGTQTMFRITVGPTHGAVAYSVAAGVEFGKGIAFTGSVAQSTSEVFVLDTARFLTAAGTILITLTPASGKKLLTDHAASMAVYNVL